MLDTNVLISMILFPSARFIQMLEGITRKNTLVLSSFVVEELLDVAQRKFPAKKDYPVLYTAIVENVDILITGDKDFSDILIEKPEIMTPAEFIEKYL